MSAPSGYTALDFVGFTDKGTYSPIVNYMRNDLVHYGGNIMRCLIDNTLNVTPVVGANWELWVGASANLAERTIAPLENNPADVAFGVGRQIIYDDWLWEVIAPIAIGDALIDYAVDPTNANIKKSAPVETQLLAVKAEADATDNMIAPTEANASSSSAAYSVGDQLILNNILYDVIAAIQIGDALTTGTGGNIAAADTLTDQLAAKANSSDLAAVATSGAYSDLSGTPTLATVATSGSYNDLSNKPTLGTAAAKDSTNAVTSGSTDLVESGAVYTGIQTLTNETSDIVDVLGAKNLLPNNATSQTVNGVTFTVNSDGSVTASGTAASNVSFVISYANYEKGKYIATKFADDAWYNPNSGEYNYMALIYHADFGTAFITNEDTEVEFNSDLSGVQFALRIASGVTINKTIYPMIRPASVADDTYVPYAKTNRELTVRSALVPDGTSTASLIAEDISSAYNYTPTKNGVLTLVFVSGTSQQTCTARIRDGAIIQYGSTVTVTLNAYSSEPILFLPVKAGRTYTAQKLSGGGTVRLYFIG